MPLPDLAGAMIAHTRTLGQTYSLCQGRVSAGRPRTKNSDDPNGWVMPTYAVVYLLVPGPLLPRPGRVPFRSQNIQVDCYGPDLRTAGTMYQTWYGDFFPVDQHQPSGFIAANCAVSSLEEIGSPMALYGGDNVWPRVTTTVLIKYFEVPVPTPVSSVFASAKIGSQGSVRQ
jgi:hypothetical protein